mmetsp:Transcript_8680/g.20071  ORF Transcript_8680/g.20071 Transcript_8680/m.20071 type:complete len:165 (-) Transcript_8680:2561-3055(-)
MNEFASLGKEEVDSTRTLQVGDLVGMTIVDVFETDNHGKLLSYCPTFDNRAVYKTSATTETLRKGSSRLLGRLTELSQSPAANTVKSGVVSLSRLGVSAAKSMATSVHERLLAPQQSKPQNEMDAKGFEQALSEAEAAATVSNTKNDAYISDDSTAEAQGETRQ